MIHTICDAILGAANLRDIGFHYSDTDEKYKGIDSKILLKKVIAIVRKKGFKLSNIDATIALQVPKVNPYVPKMKSVLAHTMGVEPGQISIKAEKLIKTTYESMMKAIRILKPGIKLGDIGYEIQSFVEEKGFSVVRDFCGHGISTTFHEPPNILHYGNKNSGMELSPGMTFTIEPMINSGKYDVKMLNDGWTAVTKDKSLSAQFEHTLGITENGYEIFTESAKGYSKPPYL